MSRRARAVCVFGTRPDAIKMAPVVRELRGHGDRWDVRIIATGQHREQLDQVLGVFSLQPDLDLGIMAHGQTLAGITTRALDGLDRALREVPADVVLAQGDTTTTFVAGLAAFYHRTPFGHVEAGLRTGAMYDPFPEEMNRRLAADFASFHFAPTEAARGNLISEGVAGDRITVTGNTGIDALLMVSRMEVAIADPDVAELLSGVFPMVLVTAHRRENWGAPLAGICRAVRRLARMFPHAHFVYALHMNPVVRDTVAMELSGLRNVHLLEPPPYGPFVKLMQRSILILTDSGGIQEEAPSLGVPVLVLRATTERPEGVTAGAARLVGTDPDVIVSNASDLIANEAARKEMRVVESPYGDGRAANRIRECLEDGINP